MIPKALCVLNRGQKVQLGKIRGHHSRVIIRKALTPVLGQLDQHGMIRGRASPVIIPKTLLAVLSRGQKGQLGGNRKPLSPLTSPNLLVR